MDSPKPKPRRKRGCAREGCKRRVRDGYRCCSYLCNVVNEELERAQRVCEASGGDTEHWLAAVTLNDALRDYYCSDSRI